MAGLDREMEVKGRGVNKREEKREEEALRRATAAGRTAARRGSSLAQKGLWSEQAYGWESITCCGGDSGRTGGQREVLKSRSCDCVLVGSKDNFPGRDSNPENAGQLLEGQMDYVITILPGGETAVGLSIKLGNALARDCACPRRVPVHHFMHLCFLHRALESTSHPRPHPLLLTRTRHPLQLTPGHCDLNQLGPYFRSSSFSSLNILWNLRNAVM